MGSTRIVISEERASCSRAESRERANKCQHSEPNGASRLISARSVPEVPVFENGASYQTGLRDKGASPLSWIDQGSPSLLPVPSPGSKEVKKGRLRT